MCHLIWAAIWSIVGLCLGPPLLSFWHNQPVFVKNDYIFSLRASRNPLKTISVTIGQYGVRQSRETTDDIRKVKRQCSRSDVLTSWHKSLLISPFQSMATHQMSEKTIPPKRSVIDHWLLLLWRRSSVTWPGPVHFFLLLEVAKSC